MARGWESKSVESQMESSEDERGPQTSLPAPHDVVREQKLASLMLSRTRVLNDLATCHNPRYKAQLEAALAHLDARIQALG